VCIINEKKSDNTPVTDIKYIYDLVGSRTSKIVNGIKEVDDSFVYSLI
jgi:uncharacterized protein YfkK (UPF0435 family)